MRRFFDILTLSSLFLLTVIPLSAQELKPLGWAESEKAVKAINEANAGVRSIRADFIQVKELTILKERMVSTGRMSLDDGILRWEYLTPEKSVFVTDQEQMKSGGLFRSIAGLMMNSVTGISLDDPAFQVAIFTPGSGYVAELTPLRREMKRMFSSIRLHFGPDNRILKVELLESQGKTTISLSNLKYSER